MGLSLLLKASSTWVAVAWWRWGRLTRSSKWVVLQWRQLEVHRAAQARGRAMIFQDYRLRIALVVRDYGLLARDEAPADSRARHGAV